MRVLLVSMLVFAQFGWSQAKPKDMCMPPPSSVAPSLPAKILTGQGEVHFAITTANPEAQKFFDQGVAQMHSFWSKEAERSFLQAAQLDPEAPMPLWGVAMVSAGDYRPRFQLDQFRNALGYQPLAPEHRAIKAALKAMELAAVPGKATEVEKLYIASIVARRDTQVKNPDPGYLEGLKELVRRYPNEVEARTYLALQSMGGFESPSRNPRPGTMEAVELLKQLMIDVPEHPGVNHYVIHGWEGSTFAKDAWASSKKYAELVTNIPHALHMPGHIYSQTGKLDEALEAFTKAAVNERFWMNSDALYGNSHHGHNVHYLATVATYKGDYDTAIAASKELLAIPENPREASALDNFQTAYKQGWFALLRTLVEAERWDDILQGEILPQVNKPRQQAWRHWALGLAQAGKGNPKLAIKEMALMDEAVSEFTTRLKLAAPEELLVAHKELQAEIWIAKGKVKRGLALLNQAAEEQRALRYTEPPWYPRPISVVVGNVSFKHGKLPEAESAFKTALEEIPAWKRAQLGLDGCNLSRQSGL